METTEKIVDNYNRIIVTWGWTGEAKQLADDAYKAVRA